MNIPSEEEEVSSSSTESSDDESHSSVTSESDYSDDIEEQQNLEMISFRRSSLFRTRKLLNFEPRIYLGILPERTSFLTLLSNKFSFDQDMFTAHDAVCLIFRKIRLNESFSILGYEFGISSRQASRIFNRHVAFIADHMQEIIFWPNRDSLKRALPISFRKNYSKIQSIIDCFEKEIQISEAH